MWQHTQAHTPGIALGFLFFPAPLQMSLHFFRNLKYLSVTGKQECDVNLKQNITLLIKAHAFRVTQD